MRRLSNAGQFVTQLRIATKILEAVRIPRVGADVGSRHPSLAIAPYVGPLQNVRKSYQPLGMGEWQRTQQYTFNDGEDGGRGPDS